MKYDHVGTYDSDIDKTTQKCLPWNNISYLYRLRFSYVTRKNSLLLYAEEKVTFQNTVNLGLMIFVCCFFSRRDKLQQTLFYDREGEKRKRKYSKNAYNV